MKVFAPWLRNSSHLLSAIQGSIHYMALIQILYPNLDAEEEHEIRQILGRYAQQNQIYNSLQTEPSSLQTIAVIPIHLIGDLH